MRGGAQRFMNKCSCLARVMQRQQKYSMPDAVSTAGRVLSQPLRKQTDGVRKWLRNISSGNPGERFGKMAADTESTKPGFARVAASRHDHRTNWLG